MGRPAGFFDVEDRLAGLSKKGDDLERLAAVVDLSCSGPSSRGRAAGGPLEGWSRRSTTC